MMLISFIIYDLFSDVRAITPQIIQWLRYGLDDRRFEVRFPQSRALVWLYMFGYALCVPCLLYVLCFVLFPLCIVFPYLCQCKIYCHRVNTRFWCPWSVLTSQYRGLKRQDAGHAPPSSAQVKNTWSYTSTLVSVFEACCLIKQGHGKQNAFHYPLDMRQGGHHVQCGLGERVLTTPVTGAFRSFINNSLNFLRNSDISNTSSNSRQERALVMADVGRGRWESGSLGSRICWRSCKSSEIRV
jgi:hypothetical protein